MEELAAPHAAALGLELVGVELVKEGAYRYLRVYIDKEGGVGFDDCEALSRVVDARLDEILPNPPYDFFEVSSPGLDRPLKREADFARYVGHKVVVTTYAPVDGQKSFVGELQGLVRRPGDPDPDRGEGGGRRPSPSTANRWQAPAFTLSYRSLRGDLRDESRDSRGAG